MASKLRVDGLNGMPTIRHYCYSFDTGTTKLNASGICTKVAIGKWRMVYRAYETTGPDPAGLNSRGCRAEVANGTARTVELQRYKKSRTCNSFLLLILWLAFTI